MKMAEYGNLVSMKDALLPADPMQQSSADLSLDLTAGSAVYSYFNAGTINGIKVADSDRNLQIDRDDVLNVAFELHSTPHMDIFCIYPDRPDTGDDYRDVLNKVYAGTATILKEDRSYDAAKGCFIVWLRYDDIEYRLNSRFDYLRSN